MAADSPGMPNLRRSLSSSRPKSLCDPRQKGAEQIAPISLRRVNLYCTATGTTEGESSPYFAIPSLLATRSSVLTNRSTCSSVCAAVQEIRNRL